MERTGRLLNAYRLAGSVFSLLKLNEQRISIQALHLPDVVLSFKIDGIMSLRCVARQ